MVYRFFQWLGFFYLYSVLGWIWESCYVSIKGRKWVNRGFLHGPVLPIYGSGALLILIITLPFTKWWQIFLIGMLGATVLEYITGDVMERIFKVRYWDYSSQPLNLNGHICLISSVCWGLFSVLLVKLVHPRLEPVILDLNQDVMVFLLIFLSILFEADVIESTREAFDLKKMIQEQIAHNEKLQSLHEQMQKLTVMIEELSEKAVNTQKERLTELLQMKQEIANVKNTLEAQKEKQKQKAIRILRRNPGSISVKLKKEFETLKAYIKTQEELYKQK